MRRTPHRRTLAATLFLACAALVPTAAVPAAAVQAATAERHARNDCPPDGLCPEVTARLEKAIEDVRRQAGIPGVVVGLWMPGKGSYVRATGVADTAPRRPMTTDGYVRIGSETKTFTVTALLELVDEHRIRLDDPISRYVHGVPDSHRITLRQLAEMRGPRAVPLRHVPPGRPGTELPHDPVQHPAVVQPLPAPQRHRQQRPDELPLGIGQFMATYHPTMIHHSRSFEDTA